jgi:hypothetical protein
MSSPVPQNSQLFFFKSNHFFTLFDSVGILSLVNRLSALIQLGQRWSDSVSLENFGVKPSSSFPHLASR